MVKALSRRGSDVRTRETERERSNALRRSEKSRRSGREHAQHSAAQADDGVPVQAFDSAYDAWEWSDACVVWNEGQGWEWAAAFFRARVPGPWPSARPFDVTLTPLPTSSFAVALRLSVVVSALLITSSPCRAGELPPSAFRRCHSSR